MPVTQAAIIFTAEPTDLITSVAHGLSTGDGAGSVMNIGGALPGGLSATTDYYWIRVDADHGKLATSVLNAQAGVAVDITSAGTGMHWFGIGLPFRRGVTYADGSIVPPGNLNAMQDCHAGQRFRPVPLNIPANAFVLPTGGSGASQAGGLWTFSTGVTGVEISAPLILPAGVRVSEVIWSVNRTNSGTITLEIRKRPMGSAQTPIASMPASLAVFTKIFTSQATTGLPITIQDGVLYTLHVVLGTNSTGGFDGCMVVVDKLL